MKKRKYKIIFWKPDNKWFLVCTRTFSSCFKLAIKQFKQKRCWVFIIIPKK